MNAAVSQKRDAPKAGRDDFPTSPWATRAFLRHAMMADVSGKTCWEPAANRGHMVRPLQERFGTVIGSDVHDYGFGFPVVDFLDGPSPTDYGLPVHWIVTNPPFNRAEQFVARALDVATEGVAIFARNAFAEGKGRYSRLFQSYPPTRIFQYTERVSCVWGGLDRASRLATAYSWFIWDIGAGAGTTVFSWIPPCRSEFEHDGDYL